MHISQYFNELQPKWDNYLNSKRQAGEEPSTHAISAYNILNGINEMNKLSLSVGQKFSYDINRTNELFDAFSVNGNGEGNLIEDRSGTKTGTFKANALIPDRGLYGVLKDVVDPLYENFVGRSILPIDNSVPAAAQRYYLDFIRHEQEPRIQVNASFAEGGMTDIDVEQSEYGVLTLEVGISITADEISEFDLRNRQSFGSRIDPYAEKLKAARKALAQIEEQLWWTGSVTSTDGGSQKLLPGFLDYFPDTGNNRQTNVNTVFDLANINRDRALVRDVSANTEQQWNTTAATALGNIVTGQIKSAIQDIRANGWFTPRLLIVPEAHWVNLSANFAAIAGTTVTKSIGELAMDVFRQESEMMGRSNMPSKMRILPTRALNANNSAYGQTENSFIMLDNMKENWCYVVPRDVYVLPPARDDRNRINQRLRMRVGGIVGKRPFSAQRTIGI